MEGDEIFASIDSVWFYSSVLLIQPPSKQETGISSGELQPMDQKDSREGHGMGVGSGGGSHDRRCIGEVAKAAVERRAAVRSRELEGRMEIWRKWWPQTTARCSLPSPMPHPGNGLAMKVHLRSWAHAVACSVR